jgi:hypothetical protein
MDERLQTLSNRAVFVMSGDNRSDLELCLALWVCCLLNCGLGDHLTALWWRFSRRLLPQGCEEGCILFVYVGDLALDSGELLLQETVLFNQLLTQGRIGLTQPVQLLRHGFQVRLETAILLKHRGEILRHNRSHPCIS